MGFHKSYLYSSDLSYPSSFFFHCASPHSVLQESKCHPILCTYDSLPQGLCINPCLYRDILFSSLYLVSNDFLFIPFPKRSSLIKVNRPIIAFVKMVSFYLILWIWLISLSLTSKFLEDCDYKGLCTSFCL